MPRHILLSPPPTSLSLAIFKLLISYFSAPLNFTSLRPTQRELYSLHTSYSIASAPTLVTMLRQNEKLQLHGRRKNKGHQRELFIFHFVKCVLMRETPVYFPPSCISRSYFAQKCMTFSGFNSPLRSVAFSPSSQRLVLGSTSCYTGEESLLFFAGAPIE